MHRLLPLVLLTASGAAGLMYEMVWLRRLGLVLGGSAVASSITVGAYMGGLALGAALSTRWRPVRPWRAYALLELLGAACALLFPVGFGWLQDAAVGAPAARWPIAVALVGVPAVFLGATWPLVARGASAAEASAWYAANTSGAVLGVLGATFFWMPTVGVRNTELAAATLATCAAMAAWRMPAPARHTERADPSEGVPRTLWVVAVAAGLSSLGLELVWMRLAAVGFGATVQTIGGVLAGFLAAMALGAAIGARTPDQRLQTQLTVALSASGLLALLGALLWSQLPYALAAAWRWGGPEAMPLASIALACLAMGGAPIASGAAFTLSVRLLGPQPGSRAATLMAANTTGSITGALVAGLWAVPTLEMAGSVTAFSMIACAAACLWSRRPWPLLLAVPLAALQPSWDARLYAVGVHLRISDFSTPTDDAVRSFVREGWELMFYDQGTTGAVAVGRSLTTGNVWISVNGKVDASTGDDMPTQRLSGAIPVAASPDPRSVLVVGLASGVTVGAALEDARVRALTVVELEPAVVEASHYFDHANQRPLDDPRTSLVIDDARAWLARNDQAFDVIISEPSNPWISGVSNLFTLEYWELANSRLTEHGVFAQWVQLYGMGPDEVSGLLRTFGHVFGDVWVYETIPGTDLLLLGGVNRLPEGMPAQPRLTPEQTRCIAGTGWLNTDDKPIVEWRAPRYLHYSTVQANKALLSATCTAPPSASPGPPRP